MSTPSNRRILVIDDTPSTHGDLRRILSGDGDGDSDARRSELDARRFVIDSAYQGPEGLAMVRSSLQADCPYALAFVEMGAPPGWHGLETVREIWKVDPRLQIVICTASDHSWDEALGALLAEDRLLVMRKPFEGVELAQLTRALTAKWEMTWQAEQIAGRLEEAVRERTRALEIANKRLEAMVGEATVLATHDALTGLPNRLLFADRATQVLAVARRTGGRPAVMMLDLDRFKEVNDTLGHLQGDRLLIEVARRLSGVLRPSDTVARFGGDEFTLLLSDGGTEGGTQVAKRIAVALQEPFVLGAATVAVEVSIGIATASSDEQPTLEGLLLQADTAMYRAKAERSGFAHFSAGNDEGTPNQLQLIGELRQAFDFEELVVYYQPKVAVDTGELLGVEALLRWDHPTRGLLLPEEFVVLAEASTLIQRLTAFVMDSALGCSRTWLDRGLRLPVAVNVSARSLCDPQFPAMVSDRLAYAGVPASQLTIELTEGTVLAYPGMAMSIVQKLRDTGVHVSVDDYGTGLSSPAILENLPVTELKIDQAFIKDLVDDPHDSAMVQSAIELGHNLGLSVVAEGVDDEMTLRTLKSIGVDVVQGHHLGQPMTETLLRSWIEDRAGTRPSKAKTTRTQPDAKSPTA